MVSTKGAAGVLRCLVAVLSAFAACVGITLAAAPATAQAADGTPPVSEANFPCMVPIRCRSAAPLSTNAHAVCAQADGTPLCSAEESMIGIRYYTIASNGTVTTNADCYGAGGLIATPPYTTIVTNNADITDANGSNATVQNTDVTALSGDSACEERIDEDQTPLSSADGRAQAGCNKNGMGT